ncbi:MAG: hypothetical protein Q8914_01010 [Bacteroidota bacterium]|nr:hypothetical protein [Bacteroidota bacterium]
MFYWVKEILDKEGWKDFLSVPEQVYRDDPNWVQPLSSEIRRVLNPAKNPYFANAVLKLFVCYSANKPIGRAILVINRLHWTVWHKKSSFFGFFEAIDDVCAVKSLFERIETESRNLGAEYLEGPFNPNHYSELGILMDHFTVPPLFFETYNPPYYKQLLEEIGFTELCRLHTRINTEIAATLSKEIKFSQLNQANQDIMIRKFNGWRLKRELDIMREINNDAFEKNWYFLPLTRKEYTFSAKFLFFVTSPGLILIAEHKGQPVGVLQLAINFNSLVRHIHGSIRFWNIPRLLCGKKKVKELVIFTFGVKKAYQHTRVAALMIAPALRIIQRYASVSSTWMSEENKSVIRFSALVGMKPYKHFGIFSKPLTIRQTDA